MALTTVAMKSAASLGSFERPGTCTLAVPGGREFGGRGRGRGRDDYPALLADFTGNAKRRRRLVGSVSPLNKSPLAD